MDTVLQVMSDEPVPPRRLNASIPRDLETICLKCLEKEPGKRYAVGGGLGEDLRRFLAGEPILARPVTRWERAVKWARRRPAIAALLGLVALVAAAGLGGVLWQWREAVVARGIAERESERAKAQTELAEREGERAKAQGRAGRTTPLRRPDDSRAASTGEDSRASRRWLSMTRSKCDRTASRAVMSTFRPGIAHLPVARRAAPGEPGRSRSSRLRVVLLAAEDRLGAGHPDGTLRAGLERRLQPRRAADRLRRWVRGEGVGRRDGEGDPHVQRP